jgi:hypothetical protein
MSLTEIARFADLAEAQIAASRLRAEGVPVLVQNEYWGGVDYLMTIAMGGFRLWAPDDQAADAKALIQGLRHAVPPPEPEDDFEEDEASAREPPVAGTVRAGAALLLSLTFGWVAGWLVAGLRRAAARGRWMLAAGGWILLVLYGVLGVVFAAALFTAA